MLTLTPDERALLAAVIAEPESDGQGEIKVRPKSRAKAPEYSVWIGMIHRCHNEKRASYKHYGGRGISVCSRWRNSFEAFVEDMGPRPSKAHSIDRFPNKDGNYEPGNCRWATSTEQNRNTSQNRMYEYRGETKCLTEWALEFGVSCSTLKYRIDVCGWDFAKAITTPIGNGQGESNSSCRLTKEIVCDIRRMRAAGVSCKQLGLKYGVSFKTVQEIVGGRLWPHVKCQLAESRDDAAKLASVLT